MKKWYKVGIINDIRTSWKSMFTVLFHDDTDELAKKTIEKKEI